MRCAESVDRSPSALIRQSDRIDHQRVAVLIVADRFPVPGIGGVLAVRHVQIDAPYLRIALIQNPDLFRSLSENYRFTGKEQQAGNAARPTARGRIVGNAPAQTPFI